MTLELIAGIDDSPESSLRDALVSEIKNELDALVTSPFTVSGRYVPRIGRKDLKDLKVSIYIAESDTAMEKYEGHEQDEDEFTIDIALQQAIPTIPTNANGRPDFDKIDNLEFLNLMLSLVNRIKELWRPETDTGEAGRLRHGQLADCDFVGMNHEPPIEPGPLVAVGVVSSIIAVTYRRGY